MPHPQSPSTPHPDPLTPASTAAPGPADRWREDRGDVPGWVLVTLMTAGLVIALWAVAGPALAGVFEAAIERVTSFGG
ncbi:MULTISPECIES: hypothetical protein [unclassified Actinotalea]|uniref:hypothetical protein n=1 Tax=unclassified Actinotalea TaxID=2638618 RepID=UPI0015F5933E|nr:MULTISPECIES: hypothetical protein [unclassified Actinotalea]